MSFEARFSSYKEDDFTEKKVDEESAEEPFCLIRPEKTNAIETSVILISYISLNWMIEWFMY